MAHPRRYLLVMNILLQKALTFFSAFGDACDLPDSTFFGLKPWYTYLDGQEDSLGQCVPKIISRNGGGDITGIDIVLIIMAVIDSLLKLAAIVAVGFVIYGGIQYIISQGEPDKTNNAKNTILNALVGMIIALTAISLVSFIGNRIK